MDELERTGVEAVGCKRVEEQEGKNLPVPRVAVAAPPKCLSFQPKNNNDNGNLPHLKYLKTLSIG